MALNHVGYNASSTSLYTVNRACSSSLQAITSIADAIRVGRINMGIGAGMESMTRNYGSKAVPTSLWPELRASRIQDARDCIMPMGLTAENVAERYKISRHDQDAFSIASHHKASRAQAAGLFDAEIVPVNVTAANPPEPAAANDNNHSVETKTLAETASTSTITITHDDSIRPTASIATMSKLNPVFKPASADGGSGGGGTITAGNSSPISDGASAVLLCRRSTAHSLGLNSHNGGIIGKFAGATVVGCPPDEMGVGPAVAIPALLAQAGLKAEDVHMWEINEAFAAQAVYCVRKLGLEGAMEQGRVNPRGGAIALGHPLGATGGRLVGSLLAGMEGEGTGRVGVVSLCVGTGMGMAALVVRE